MKKVIALLLLSFTLHAEPVPIDFQDADISRFIEIVSDMTGRNFIPHPSLEGVKVSAYLQSNLDNEEVYDYFLTVMEVHGFEVIQQGDYYKIMPVSKRTPRPVTQAQAPASLPKPIVKAPEPPKENKPFLITLANADAAYIAGIFRGLEVSNDLASELGVQLKADKTNANDRRLYASSSNTAAVPLSKMFDEASITPGLLLGFGGGFFGADFGALLKALNNDGKTNILSTPTVVTMSNKQASIVVGQNVPFVTGKYVSDDTNATSNQPFQTIERHDVGLKFAVTPRLKP